MAVNIAGPADMSPTWELLFQNIKTENLGSPVNKLYMGEREVADFSIELALNN